MVRSLRSVKRTEMSARGDNTTVSPPYYFRHCARQSAKPRDHVMPKQNVENKSPIIITNRWCKEKRNYCNYCLAGTLAISLCLIFVSVLFPYPIHASCIVKWTFGDQCTFVMQKFRSQIMNWSSWNVCRQRSVSCMYTLKIPAEENVIKATHTVSNFKSLEEIKIVFEEVNDTCLATGNSVSNEWFAIFDYGANYCNLHNLVVGAGFDRHTKFLELTNDAVCTQFNMAVCG